MARPQSAAQLIRHDVLSRGGFSSGQPHQSLQSLQSFQLQNIGALEQALQSLQSLPRLDRNFDSTRETEGENAPDETVAVDVEPAPKRDMSPTRRSSGASLRRPSSAATLRKRSPSVGMKSPLIMKRDDVRKQMSRPTSEDLSKTQRKQVHLHAIG